MNEYPVYVGIDQSVSGFAVTYYSPHDNHHKVFVEAFPRAKYKTEVHQLHAMEDFLINSMNGYHHRIRTVAREGFAYGSSQGREKAGAIAYAVDKTLFDWLPEGPCYPLVIPPSTLKKYVTGNGGASKQQVIDRIDALWGVKFTDDNAADSYALARLAYSIHCGESYAPYQQEVLEQVRNPKPKKRKRRKTA